MSFKGCHASGFTWLAKMTTLAVDSPEKSFETDRKMALGLISATIQIRRGRFLNFWKFILAFWKKMIIKSTKNWISHICLKKCEPFNKFEFSKNASHSRSQAVNCRWGSPTWLTQFFNNFIQLLRGDAQENRPRSPIFLTLFNASVR